MTEQTHLRAAFHQAGGLDGAVLTVVPVVTFVAVNALTSMWPAIFASVGAAVVVGVIQLARRKKPTAALGGLGGVLVSSAVAALAGEAKGYYLWGMWITLTIGSILLLSVITRWPLIGVAWSTLNGTGSAWRTDRRSQLYYGAATLFWSALCFTRFSVENWLYRNDEVTSLGVARLLMGWPLTLLAALVSLWAIRMAAKDTLGKRASH
ncbi:DUF3159 domain-containing protein [Lentzea californiensis]|uniref:DUF3159 domain-containing protein n=1 Tax=Lentzea californiensis TaxID=438851 RepID=UPI0021658029|nr:DUF3159 domain-containing protein [Lentzea californiensis]MCR3753212.1 Protein of unknown function (DUF3159) [Lentzea californiensis]